VTSPVRVVIYLRISLDAVGLGLAVERQREECMRLIRERGWQFVREYADNSISASKRTTLRPAYEQMVSDFEAGEFDAIVCYDLDRLTRQPRQLEDWCEAAEEKGLKLVTANGEADLSNYNGRTFARIKASIARGEMEAKSARQKAAHVQRAQMGKPWANRRPFGFLDGGSEHHPEEAPILAGIYNDILMGAAQTNICSTLNQSGVTTTQGNQWRQSSLRQLLLNPRNAGLRARHGVIVGQGLWQPIVTEDVWRAACNIVTSHPLVGHRGSLHLLSGLLTCGLCGSPMTTGYTSRKVRMYRCTDCKRVGRNADNVDEWIAAVVTARLNRPDADRLLVDNNAPNVTGLQDEVRRLEAVLEENTKMRGSGDMSVAEWKTAKVRTSELIEATRAKITKNTSAAILEPLVNAPDAAIVWQTQPVDRRRAVIGTLARIVVNPTRKGAKFNPDDIDVQWRIDA